MALFQVVSNRDLAVPARHAGSIALKHLVKKHWKAHFSDAERQTIREKLPAFLVVSGNYQTTVEFKEVTDEALDRLPPVAPSRRFAATTR